MKSECSSILHLTCILFLPGLQSCALSAFSFPEPLLLFPINCSHLCTVAAKGHPCWAIQWLFPQAQHWPTAREDQAEPKQMSSAWPPLYPPRHDWLTSLWVWKQDFWSKQGRNTKHFSQLSQLSASTSGSNHRAHQKPRTSHAVWRPAFCNMTGCRQWAKKQDLRNEVWHTADFLKKRLVMRRLGPSAVKGSSRLKHIHKKASEKWCQRTTTRMITNVSKGSYVKMSGPEQWLTVWVP